VITSSHIIVPTPPPGVPSPSCSGAHRCEDHLASEWRPCGDSRAGANLAELPCLTRGERRCDPEGLAKEVHLLANTLIVRYLRSMTKTSVVVDQDIAREAAAILGTKTLRDTIDAALREIVQAKRRLELVALLSTEGRFDFGEAEQACGGQE
jgi:Arc/MetJ family transcription regulator